jgi:hypothetical protein
VRQAPYLNFINDEQDQLFQYSGLYSPVRRDSVCKLTDRPAYAYPVLAIGVISWLLPLWTRTQWYHDGAAEELGNDYADGLMLLANWWGLLLITAITAIMGFLGIRLVAGFFK